MKKNKTTGKSVGPFYIILSTIVYFRIKNSDHPYLIVQYCAVKSAYIRGAVALFMASNQDYSNLQERRENILCNGG